MAGVAALALVLAAVPPVAPRAADDALEMRPAPVEVGPPETLQNGSAGHKLGSGHGPIKPLNQAWCLLERAPKLSAPPQVFFFAAQTHSSKTLGCSKRPADGLTLSYKRATLDANVVDELIKTQLIETKLFDPNLTSYFIVHGFLGAWNKSKGWMCQLKDLTLNNSLANVFLLDWSGGARPRLFMDYGAAVAATPLVGRLLGQFIQALARLSGQLDAQQYHLIGHSLGAHVCAFAGYQLNSTLGRITGLDPAGPCFRAGASARARSEARETGRLGANRRRLSRASARNVMALHTDGELFGLGENCAHRDVYVNGGLAQPSCETAGLASMTNLFCAHRFAHSLFDGFIKLAARALGFKRARAEPARASRRGALRPEEACHLVAYECSDWPAFQAGECGFCGVEEEEQHCAFVGLTPTAKRRRRVTRTWLAGWGQADNKADHDDEIGDKIDGAVAKLSRSARRANESNSNINNGQLYIRTGGVGGVCLYHYQVIIAMEARNRTSGRASSKQNRRPLVLHLPLSASGELADANGRRLPDKLVKVSHELKPTAGGGGGGAFERMKFDYIDALQRQLGGQLEAGRLGSRDNIAFLTALITFGRESPDKCGRDADGAVALKGRKRGNNSNNNKICRPLREIREARLLAASKARLDAVKWVALNYMSGFDLEWRARNSFLLLRKPGERAQSRAAAARGGRKSKRAPIVRRALKYSLALEPVRLGDASERASGGGSA